MQNYIANKEREDALNDEWRKKSLKARELDTKRWLDIQLQQREEAKRLQRFEAGSDAAVMLRDLEAFTQEELRRSQEVLEKNALQQTGLVRQIEDRKKPRALDPVEFQINKKILDQIQLAKSTSQLLSPVRKTLPRL